VRLQTSTGGPISGGSLHGIGFSQLFRGTGPAVVSAVLENSVVFGANLALKSKYLGVTNRTDADLSTVELAWFGGAAGVFSALSICPAEMIKVRLQSSKHGEFKGGLDCLKRTIREEGALSLFRGLPAQLARDVPFNLVFFSSFENCCRAFGALRGGCEKKDLSAPDLILAGGLAGAMGWTVTLPMDLIKSRAQAMRLQPMANMSPIQLASHLIKSVYREAGIRGFFKGWTAAVTRSFPVNGALFCTFEMCERTLQQQL